MDKQLYVGFGRCNINPPMGIEIAGYFISRKAEAILDDLESNAVAIRLGEKTILLISVDSCGMGKIIMDELKKRISEKTGVEISAIFISATHTHTGPMVTVGNEGKKASCYSELKKDGDIGVYREFMLNRVVDVATFAIADLKEAKMGYGVGKAEKVAFIRRYRMKDGSAKTNPGVNNPDIVAPIGEVDESVNVLRFDRKGAESVVFVNFANHPDVVGGCKISADWPGFTRRFVEKAIDNTKCIFFNGAQGDVNHVNVHPTAGDFNDMFNDFDGCSRGYGHSRHIGRVVAGAVMQVYDKVNYVDVDKIGYLQEVIEIPSNMPTPEQIPLAHKYNDLHNAGRDEEIPFKAMMLTTVVAEAARMVRLEHGPEKFDLLFSAVSIGNVALFGIPGEPFTGIGRGLKQAKGWDLVIPCCITNGYEGYFPMKDSYDEGGYEARSSSFKAGSAEKIIEEGKKILDKLR